MSDRVVYDCLIYLQAALRPERSHTTMVAARTGRAALCVSPEILAEVRDVLTRPEIQSKSPALTPESVDGFIKDLASFAQWFNDVPDVYRLERDPKDSKYINLALAAEARWIVTWDNDLLDLMDCSSPTGKAFMERFPNLRIVQPPTFARELAASSGN
jgi:putative PIN family toxin of toxin-antitoxin system